MKFNNRNVSISSQASIGKNVRIGDNATIYDNVIVGDDCIICNDCVLGEPLNDYYTNDAYINPTTQIGKGSVIRSHSIIYAGCEIGENFASGHRVTIREGTVIGKETSIGTLSDIQGKTRIGHYCRLHSNVHIAQQSTIGNFVFMYPYSVMTNDPYTPSEDILGSYIGDYTQVGSHAIIFPGIKVGTNCLIGAGSSVSKNIPDYFLAKGEPAKVIMDVREYRVMGKGRPYPWMKRFDRGMPWEGIGYEEWSKENGKEI
jgi:acetyltransferase-like isoleucine patch superfamily enzyme